MCVRSAQPLRADISVVVLAKERRGILLWNREQKHIGKNVVIRLSLVEGKSFSFVCLVMIMACLMSDENGPLFSLVLPMLNAWQTF
jgi:hypothetical protein